MRVLVTGGAGFIGSHIMERLLAEGIEAAALDDLSSGRRENLPAGTRLFETDLRDARAVGRVFEEYRPTHVSHQAAQASVKRSVDDPAHDAAVNVLGGLNLLECARRHGIEKVVFASTGGALYGEVPGESRADESWPARPHSPYAASKASFELYLQLYEELYGLPHVVLRYANVYGPRQDPHGEAGVVAIFCHRLLAGEPVQVNARRTVGDDGCVRDYVHVSDVVAANLAALAEPWTGTFNVSTGSGRSTRELLDGLATELAVAPAIHGAPHRAGDLERSVLDPGRLLARGWPSPLEFAEGIRRTAAWFRSR